MKLIKSAIFFLVVLVCLVFNGEMFQDYFMSFYAQFPSLKLKNETSVSQEIFFEDITAIAKEHNVTFFINHIVASDSNADKFIVYSNNPDSVEKAFKDECQIEDKLYKSIFLPSTEVVFSDLKSVVDINYIDSAFYLIGESGALKNFHLSVSKTYLAGAMRDAITVVSPVKLLLVCWGIVMALMLLLSWYSVLMNKKEWFVKISMGERAWAIILKSIAIDTVCFSAIFSLLLFTTSLFTTSLFNWQLSLTMFGVTVLLNALPNLLIFKGQWKEAFSNRSGSRGLLSASYAIKLITTVLTALAISGNFVMIFESLSFYRQKDFFEDYKDYNYASVAFRIPSNLDENESMQAGAENLNKAARFYYHLYKKTYSDKGALLQSKAAEIHLSTTESIDVLYMNRYTKNYLLENMEGITAEMLDDEKVYCLLPAMKYTEQQAKEEGEDMFYPGFLDYPFETEVIRYSGNVDLIGIGRDSGEGSSYFKNSMIVFINLDESKRQVVNEYLKIESAEEMGGGWAINAAGLFVESYMADIMYNMTPEEIRDFAKTEFDFNPEIDTLIVENVYDVYMDQWASMKTLLYFNCALSVLMIILELIVIITLVKLEYSMNAMEMALKKVLGYSIWNRNKTMLIITLAVAGTGIIGALVMNSFFGISQAVYVLAGCILLAAADIAVTLYYVSKMEKVSIQKIWLCKVKMKE